MSLNRSNNSLLLVLNPVAGKGKGKELLFRTVEALTKHGFRVTVLPTVSGEQTEKTVCEECHKYGTVVAIGGDGTLNNVVNGIMKSGENVPLGYIPLGSTNDFARSLGLPSKLDEAIDAIALREPRPIDVGLFGDRYFVYIACTGMFVDASYKTSQKMKNRFGHSAYIFKGASTLKNTHNITFTIECDGEALAGVYILAAVSSTLSVGGVFKYPKKDVIFDDGYFEFTAIKALKGVSDTASLVNSLMHGNLDSRVFIKRKAKRVRLVSDTECGWSLDGENGGEVKEVDIEIKEKALRLIY